MVRVRAQELRGVTHQVLKVTRRFTIVPGAKPGEENVIVSSRNIATNIDDSFL